MSAELTSLFEHPEVCDSMKCDRLPVNCSDLLRIAVAF